jgi:hypothetical protein
MNPDLTTPLGDVRDWLRTRIDDGERCPCCTQYAKVYRRSLPNATARVMIALHRAGAEPDAYLFLPTILDTMKGTPHQGGYGTLGQHWGLLEQQPGERDDGSNRVGWWRLTLLGRAYVRDEVTVPRYAHIYNGRCLRLSGEPWSIRNALGRRFYYNELMAA